MCAKLGSALGAFDELTFDEDRKMVFYFDSEKKLGECKTQLEELNRQAYEEQQRLHAILRKQEEEKQRLAEEERIRKEIEEQEIRRKEIERKAEDYKQYRKICNLIFTSRPLSSSDYNCLIKQLRENSSKRQTLLQAVYNFTSQHRRDTQCVNIPLYSNSIRILTDLYDKFAATDNPSVMTCLRRCWENLGELTTLPNMPDLAVDLLFSPALSHLNYKYFGFIFNRNHLLKDDEKNKIQDWIRAYHKGRKTSKERYTHFFAWMVLLNNKVRVSQRMQLGDAHKLMRDKYQVIRAVISVHFGFLSGIMAKATET